MSTFEQLSGTGRITNSAVVGLSLAYREPDVGGGASMSKRLDGVLVFCSQYRHTFAMIAKLGQECLKTIRATGISVVWRRVPITTITLTLVIGFWLYDYVSVSSVAASSTPRASIAVENVSPPAVKPLQEGDPSYMGETTKTGSAPHAKPTHSAFRRMRVGENEVDYVAEDVTIRLFTPRPTPTRVPHLNR
jgi:hypothetical protein